MRKVAIVGMSCRLPGGLDTLDELWQALCTRRNTVADVPPERWSADWYHSSDASAPGKAYVRRGNFLKQDIRDMDAAFFDLPPRVAENLDPQQRVILEVVWEAFENAGIPLPGLAGENVGVYVGGFMLDHMITQMAAENAALINQNTAAGMMMTMLSNRISHAFDLRGPSLSIDTACSSSLTAFNYGCRDIQSGACDIAVVGGVNIMTRPEYPVGMSKGQFLARDGECKSFDARGDGYGRGEGAAIVVLKPLDQAIADGDHILAEVLATGVNSDGRTPGISMPSGLAQESLASSLCEENGIDPKSIHYIECHGTGTAIGDPTEAASVGRVFGADRKPHERAVIGTIKSNIGHTEAVAGIAGVVKAVLSLVNRVATPLANLTQPNPDIAFDELGLRLADELIPLGEKDRPLRAAVNSFGYGGTNAHAILESVPQFDVDAETIEPARDFPHMLPISARSDKALRALARRLSNQIANGNSALPDILYSAAFKRAHLSHRAVAIGASAEALAAALNNFANGDEEPSVISDDVPFGGADKPVFVYTGMGPQWWAMGQQLYRDNERFRDALNEADEIFTRISGFSILEQMQKDEPSSQITRTEYAQPANFMIQYGLTQMLEAAGVEPGAIVGHSVGEVASAWASGALSLEDALTVSYHRSRTQGKTAGTGSMLAIGGLSEPMLAPYLQRFGGKIDIAAINGPSSMTVSGDSVSIRALASELTRAEIFNRILTVEVPYHSYLMDPVTGELIDALQGLQPSVPQRPLYSTVSGEQVLDIRYDGPYWAQNVRRPVLFMESMKNLMDAGYSTFIEIGPHPVLSSAIRDCARTFGKDVRLVETLRRGTEKRPARPELQAVHAAIAASHAAGADINWHKLTPAGRFTRLPNYPWQRERHWLESELGQIERLRHAPSPLLGFAKTAASHMWRNDLTHDSVAYLYDHVVTGAAVMPAAGYIEMLVELGDELFADNHGIDVRDLRIAAPMVLNRGRSLEIVSQHDPVTREVQIRSAESGTLNQRQLHVSAQIGHIDRAETNQLNLDDLIERFESPTDVTSLYGALATMGLQYGPAFQTIEQLYLNPHNGESLACLQLDDSLCETAGYRLHPCLLDGCFQMLMGALRDSDSMYLPTGFDSIRVLTKKTPQRLWCHGEVISQSARHIVTNLTLLDEAGYTIAVVNGMQATAASSRNAQRLSQSGEPVDLEEVTYTWRPGEAIDDPVRVGRWLVLCDDDIAPRVIGQLESMGAMPPVRVTFADAYSMRQDEATMRAGSDEDAAALLRDAGEVHGIAFMHGLAAGGQTDRTGETAIETMLAVTRAVATLPDAERPRIYYVTRNAYAADTSDLQVNPAQTAIGAFMRVAHNEVEWTKATLLDLPRRINEQVIEDVVAELLGDADEDEVAFRGGRRLVSVLQHTDAASRPIAEDTAIDDDTVFRVRPAHGQDDEGMVGLQQLPLAPTAAGEIRICIDRMSIPNSLLADPNRDTLDQAFVAIVGELASVGDEVDDLSVGQRVYGYVPADFASHVQAPRSQCHLAVLDDTIEAADALAALETQVIATYAAMHADLDAGDSALVQSSDKLADAIATQLLERGVHIRRVGDDDLHAAIDAAIVANHGPFDAVVAPLGNWLPAAGIEYLKAGALLIDSDSTAGPVRLPAALSGILRCDLSVAGGRPKRLQAALTQVAQALADGDTVENNGIEIGLLEVASQRFDIPPTELRFDIHFNAAGEVLPVRVKQRVELNPEASYLVTGGLGGFGMKTASWLVAHGARTLVLASRSGANSDAKQAFVAELVQRGIRVETPECDLSDQRVVNDMIAWIAAELPPLKGIYHSAAVIEDHDIAELPLEVFHRVMRAKASSAWALHEATLDIALDQFVCYSSIASVVGNRRQAAYSAANGYLSGLVYYRRSLGLHGLSVVWGAIGDAGVVADNPETEEFLRYIGIHGLSSSEALSRMEQYIARDLTEISCALMAGWGNWMRYEPVGSKSPRFADMLANTADGTNSEAREQLIDELAPLQQAERIEVLAGLIAAIVANELRQDAQSLSIDRPINDLGVDSLMATEIQLLLAGTLGLSISVMDLLGGTTIRTLTDKLLAELELDQPAAQAATGA